MFNRTEDDITKDWDTNLGTPLVSICCITYNHENFISLALNSFLMQETTFPFEIIIRDDASTDKTAEIIKDYVRDFPNIIKPIYEFENGYQKGIKPSAVVFKKATGFYIALCEGDDFWTDKKKLQLQICKMKQNANCGLSFHLSSKIYNSGEIVNPTLLKNDRIFSTKEIIAGEFDLVQTNTIIFKREVLKGLDMDLFKRSPVGDVWIRNVAAIPDGAYFINKVMAAYRVQSAGSWSSSIESNNIKFLNYINSIMSSVNEFDKFWEYNYTKEFRIFKNRFIRPIMKRGNLSKSDKIVLLKKHSNTLKIVNLLEWHLLYRHEKLVEKLRKLKIKIKGVL